jgi:flagellar motor switch protein FliN/FliY
MEADMGKSTAHPGINENAVNSKAITQQTEVKTSQTSANPESPTAVGKLGNLEFILDIPMMLTVELGRSQMLINELLKLGRGSVIELSKLAGEPLDILANQRLIARGEVVLVNEKYGIRITEIISPAERVEKLR